MYTKQGRIQEFVQGGLNFFLFFQGGSAPVGAWKAPEIHRFWSRGGLAPVAPLNTPLIPNQTKYILNIYQTKYIHDVYQTKSNIFWCRRMLNQREIQTNPNWLVDFISWSVDHYIVKKLGRTNKHSIIYNQYSTTGNIYILLDSPGFSWILLHSPGFSCILLDSPGFS